MATITPQSPREFESTLKKGCPKPGEVEMLYFLREIRLSSLQMKGQIGAGDVKELDRLGRVQVASRHWSLCSEEARQDLLQDEHHQVRSCALIAQQAGA